MNGKGLISSNKFHWLYLIGFFLILALPLLAVPPWFHPPAWGKTIVFRIILSVLIFFSVYQILFKKHLGLLNISRLKEMAKGSKSLSFWLLIALWGVFLLATIFSLDPRFSFWGSPYRAGGFLNFSFYIIFALFTFLILKAKNWQKVWDFTFATGILVSLMAIFQKFSLFSDVLLPKAARPTATMGGAIFLAIYLLLLTFLALSFGIKERSKKKLFYFFSAILFLFVIFLTATRAALLGLLAGFLFFIFFYSARKSFDRTLSKKIVWLKIFAAVILIFGILGSYWLSSQPQLVQFLGENKIWGHTFQRLWAPLRGLFQDFSISKVVTEIRFSGWQVSLQALKERPLLGYGPENFSIGFDKYYDSSLPGITKITETIVGIRGGWWDRAHNFIFDISATAGIPALIIYLSLFGVLFWQLQKTKKKKPDQYIICHGIQATFLAYLTANFFGFDVFSTYLILFFLIGYSFFLIYENNMPAEAITMHENKQKNINKYRIPIILILAGMLIWFIWSFNLKPFQINKEMNWADYYSENQKCDKALERIDKILPSQSIIDHYLRLQYIDIIRNCLKKKSERKLELSQKAIEILEENIELRPYYTRNWLLLGAYTNIFIEKSKDLEPELKEELLKKADSYLEKAHQLSPKRQEVFLSWIKTDILSEKYQEAKEKAEQCINLNPEFKHCWWEKAISNIYLGEIEEAEENMEMVAQEGFDLETKDPLSRLANAYIELLKEDPNNLEYYQALVEIYPKLIKIEPKNLRYHASLACAYKALGNYGKAREEASIAIKLSPEWSGSTEELLATVEAFLISDEVCK